MHWQIVHIKAIVRPLRGRFYYLAVKPQVSFATLSSPAVTDIRRLRRRLLEINDHNIQAKVQQNIASANRRMICCFDLFLLILSQTKRCRE